MIRKAKFNEDGTMGSEEVPFNDPGTAAGSVKWMIKRDENGDILFENASVLLKEEDFDDLIYDEETLRERQALLDAGIIGFQESIEPYDWEKEGDFAN
jgi:hypothetical protein